eukprot:1444627-Rhodomonas_salina.1
MRFFAVNKNAGLTTEQNFARNVTVGLYAALAGFEQELKQTGTFVLSLDRATTEVYNRTSSRYVSTSADLPTLFVVNATTGLYLALSPEGELAFEVRGSANGEAVCSVLLVDDGGSAYGGENQSVVHTFTLYIVSYYTVLSFQIRYDNETGLLNNGTLSNISAAVDKSVPFSTPEEIFAARQAIADQLGIHISLVQIELPSRRRRLLSDTLLLNVIISCSTVQQCLSLDLSSEVTAGLGEITASNVTLLNIATYSLGPSGQPNFDIHPNMTEIVIDELECSDSLCVFPDFLSNFTVPVDTELDAHGNEVVVFTFAAVGGTIGRDQLLTVSPSLSFICDPNCRAANLTFSTAMWENGEILFEVSMLGRDEQPVSTKTFKLIVQPVNQAPSFDVNVSEIVEWEVLSSTRFVESLVVVNIRRGPLASANEDNQTLSFIVTFVSGNANLFAAGFEPYISAEPNISDAGQVQFTLVPYENGDATFNI